MNTKLTLTLEDTVIKKAKVYAKLSGRSLSDLVETYLREITLTSEELKEEVPDAFKNLFGSVKLSVSMDDKAVIRSIMNEKHRQ